MIKSTDTTKYHHGSFTRYVKLRDTHAPGMPGTFSPPPRVSDPDMHPGVTHVPSCMPGSLTSGFVWRRWRGKRSRHSRRMHIPRFYVCGKRPIKIGRGLPLLTSDALLTRHIYRAMFISIFISNLFMQCITKQSNCPALDLCLKI